MKTDRERIIYKTSGEVIEALRPAYPANAYAFLTEVGNSTGFRCNRHADVIVMSLWPSRGLEIIGMEVKVSRSDWLSELNNPEKAEVIFDKCDRWYLVVGDENIVKDGELPKGWGLMVPKKDGLRTKVAATVKEPEPEPNRAFIAAVLRQCCSQLTDESRLKAEYQRGYKAGKKEAEEQDWSKRDLAELKKSVAAFEKASGVAITNRWENPEKVGAAVYQVLHGMGNRIREQLEGLHGQALRIATSIEDELAKQSL